jgi:hypothetical protein
MPKYSDFVDRILLHSELLEKLCPTEPLSWPLMHKIRDADDATLLGEVKGDAAMIRAGLYYAVDALDPAHRIFQDEKSDLGTYWHGMMHRRESDFDNARYWFRRSGRLPFFPKLHRTAGEIWGLAARQSDWDPYLFTGECEQARFGAENGAELAKVQRAEFEATFDYTWRQAAKSSVVSSR